MKFAQPWAYLRPQTSEACAQLEQMDRRRSIWAHAILVLTWNQCRLVGVETSLS